MNIIQYVFGLFVVCFSIGCVSVDNPTPSDPDDIVTEALKEGVKSLLLEKKFVRKNYSEIGGFFILEANYNAYGGLFGANSKMTDGVNSPNDIDTFVIRYGSEKTLYFFTDLLVFSNSSRSDAFYGITFTIRVSESGDVSVKPIIKSDLDYVNNISGYSHNRDFVSLKRSDISGEPGEDTIPQEKILASFDIEASFDIK